MNNKPKDFILLYCFILLMTLGVIILSIKIDTIKVISIQYKDTCLEDLSYLEEDTYWDNVDYRDYLENELLKLDSINNIK